MPEIPDYISLSDLEQLSKAAQPGRAEFDANELKRQIFKHMNTIAELQRELDAIQSSSVGQERLIHLQKASAMLMRTHYLLVKSIQT